MSNILLIFVALYKDTLGLMLRFAIVRRFLQEISWWTMDFEI